MSSTCNPITSFGKLLNKIAKQSLISSQLWNDIIQDLYTAYSVYKYINTSLQYQFQYEFSYGNLNTLNSLFNNLYFYIFNQKPYQFVPLINASPGLPLTVNYMNNLIKAITKLANENNITLAKPLNFVQSNEIVKSRKFNDIIYVINQFLTFDFNSYFLLDCYGSIFSNLVNSQSAFLNILIDNPSQNISTNNIYIKNLIINYLKTVLNFYGNSAIDNFLIGNHQPPYLAVVVSSIYLYNNSAINNLIIYENYGYIQLNDNSYIQNLIISINNATIELNDNAIIENLICKQNYGQIQINGNAQIINNNCQ